jgi:GTPase SAR1 family protein
MIKKNSWFMLVRDEQAAGRPVRYKVLLDGSAACGKTCLRKSMQGQPFDPIYVSLSEDGPMV